MERARAYRAMCDRPRRAPRPRTFEELLNYGVVLHNRGEFAQAVRYLQLALEIHPGTGARSTAWPRLRPGPATRAPRSRP